MDAKIQKPEGMLTLGRGLYFFTTVVEVFVLALSSKSSPASEGSR